MNKSWSTLAALETAPTAQDVRDILRSGKPTVGRVSVIIPVYQGERFILGAVRSALRQTYADLEVLVVDDGSSDGTATKLSQIVDPRVTVLRQANQGLSAARNLGIANASGEYIAFLDADDRWFPDKVNLDLRTLRMQANPVAIAYGWYYAVDENGKLLNRSRRYNYSGNVFGIMLRSDDFILPSASFFHRGVFEEVGGFDVGSYHEDRILFIKAAKLFAIWPTQSYAVVYLQSLGGLGRRALLNFEKARGEALSIMEYLEQYLSAEEADILRKQQLRSLYCRFLMYGFSKFAARLYPEVDRKSLRHGIKGWIAWLHATAGINLMFPTRLAIQRINGALGQRRWHAALERSGLDLAYGVALYV